VHIGEASRGVTSGEVSRTSEKRKEKAETAARTTEPGMRQPRWIYSRTIVQSLALHNRGRRPAQSLRLPQLETEFLPFTFRREIAVDLRSGVSAGAACPLRAQGN
jgi:hypothetical protein